MKQNSIVKVMLCLLLCTCIGLNLKAQQKTVSINVHKTTLAALFQELRQQTGVEFVYSEAQAKALEPITLSVKGTSLENVLKKLLSNSNYTFTLKNKAVLIVPKENTKDSGKNTTKNKIQISGTVADAKGNPLARVTIKVPGTSTFTMTDNKGLFSILINDDEKQIQISSVGFLTQLVNVIEKKVVKVILKDGTNELDDVVVVAYGTSTKREQTGSLSVVTAKEIADVPASSVVNLLQGRVAGLDITNMSGSPGSGGTAIVIRGYNSLDVEQERRYSSPLWVVDGIPMNSFTSPVTGTNLLSDLNPDMIESIQVLKDASSAAIYGSRAANGVILVTTKKGKKDQKATFSFNGSRTVSILPRLPTITTGRVEREFRLNAYKNTYQTYVDIKENFKKFPQSLKDVYMNGGSIDAFWDSRPIDITSNGGGIYQDSLNNFYNNSTNFFPLFFETANVSNANFQTYGGSGNTNYGIGLGYYKEDGILKGTGYNRIDFNTSFHANPVHRAIVDAQINLTTGTRKRGTPSQSSNLRAAPLIETIPGDPLRLSSLYPGGDSPVWETVRKKQEGTEETNRSLRMRGSLRIGYDILKGLNFSSTGSIDYSLERRNFFVPSYLDSEEKGRNTSLGEQGINLMALNENLLTYKTSFGDHNFSLLAGQSFQYDQSEYNGGLARNTPSDLIWYASTLLPQYTKDYYGNSESIVPLQRYMSDMWEKTLLSWFGRVEYNYKQRYLLSVALRRDGSSVFGENNKWGTFPSIGAGYNFSEDLSWESLSFGKLRASWGRSGNQFYSPYLALGILSPGYPFQGQGTLQPQWEDGLYNQNLSWEQTDQYDFGIDLDFFDSRLSVVGDFYHRFTDQMLDKVPLQPGYNTYRNQWRNAGAISNEGVELLVKYEVLRNKDLYWKVSFNGSRNWNRFAKSYGNYAETVYNNGRVGRILGKPLNGILTVQTNGFINNQNELPKYYYADGLGSYFSLVGSYQPGDWNVLDADGDGSLSSSDYLYQGSALPIMNGGFGSEFRYKNFDCNFLFSYQLGRHIINMLPGSSFITDPDNAQHPILLDLNKVSFWEKSGDVSDYPQNKYELVQKVSFMLPVDRYVQKVNWLKLKSIVAGYNFKPRKLGIDQLRLFVSAENLFTVTNYKGIDPEVVDLSSGYDSGRAYPLARKITFGLNLKF